jgi:hypothetical protein
LENAQGATQRVVSCGRGPSAATCPSLALKKAGHAAPSGFLPHHHALVMRKHIKTLAKDAPKFSWNARDSPWDKNAHLLTHALELLLQICCHLQAPASNRKIRIPAHSSSVGSACILRGFPKCPICKAPYNACFWAVRWPSLLGPHSQPDTDGPATAWQEQQE